jgi:catechol 2,3-dioxygenase-like lactoylglutathione lyase family enzyme
MAPTMEKISAVTFRVVNMTESVRFYRDVLGMELLYGGEGTGFSSLHAKDTQSAILNLEQGKPVTRWGRLIFYVTDVDALWNHLKDRGFDPEIPRDASWGERYFHMPDPDSHELVVCPEHSPIVTPEWSAVGFRSRTQLSISHGSGNSRAKSRGIGGS